MHTRQSPAKAGHGVYARPLSKRKKPMILLIKYILFGLTFLCISCNSIGQGNSNNKSAQASKDNLKKMQKKTIEYGPKDVVTSGYLDSKGNLWFGTTQEGVFKYDGNKFKNYSKSNGLFSNNVNSILEDAENNMWFGTDEGLCKYDGKNFYHIPIPSDGSSGSKTVLCLMQDKKGFIWLGTWGGGAFRYDGKEFKSFLAKGGRLQPDGLHHNVIRSIIEDTNENIWISSLSHGGTTRYDGKAFTNFKETDGLCDDMVFCSFQDSKENIWFGSNEGGDLCKYNGEEFIHFSAKDGLCDNFVSCFYEDDKENIWIGSESPGVCIYNGKSFKPFITESGKSIDSIIRFILEDRNGNIWFGGRVGSLWMYNGKDLTNFTDKKYN